MSTITTDRPISNWTPEELPDLAGKRFIITGGNSGIGFEAARLLAARGADVVIAARDAAKGQSALAKIADIGSGTCETLHMNLADMASIRAAAEEAKARFSNVTVLINNAGVMQTPKAKTADGFELQLGTNHLGHFLWTALMIGALDSTEGRVVTVSSIMHKLGRIDIGNLMLERGYNPNRAYNQSKLANLIFALELHRRLEAAGSAIRSVACHPGYSDTPLQSKVHNPLLKLSYSFSNTLFAQPARLGAWPTALAAADPRAASGGYYGPTGLFDARGPVGESQIERRARDEATATHLWEASEELVSESFAV
ncbi:MAG: oxidoreductase [Pseudomonadota bacterium]